MSDHAKLLPGLSEQITSPLDELNLVDLGVSEHLRAVSATGRVHRLELMSTHDLEGIVAKAPEGSVWPAHPVAENQDSQNQDRRKLFDRSTRRSAASR